MSQETRLIVDGKPVGPLAYRGKKGCDAALCTREMVGRGEDGAPVWAESCYGWHCSYCDEPCSYQGHGCEAATAILRAASSDASTKEGE